MAKVSRNVYQFPSRGFDPETKAHIEQHRKQSLRRKPSTLTPLAETLAHVVNDLVQAACDRKAA